MARSFAGPDEVSLGSISGIFGLGGEVRVFLHNRESGLLETPRPVVLVSPDGERRPSRLRTRPGAGGRVLGRLDGVGDREQARALMGWEILIARSELPRPEEGEYYHHQLLGLAVVDRDGRPLGTLRAVHEGQVDLWEVRGPEGTRYVPALSEIVLDVDLAAGRLVVAAEDVPLV